MRRNTWLAMGISIGLTIIFVLPLVAQQRPRRPAASAKPQAAGVQWIWFDEGDPGRSAPAETRYFRKVFMIDRPVQKVVDEAQLDITADNEFTVWVNGQEVGTGNKWERVYRFDVQKLMVHGQNIVTVMAKNEGESPAGLLVKLGYVPNGQSKLAMVSDGTWKSSKTAPEGWQKLAFDDSSWRSVKVIGPYGQAGPWKNQVWDAGGTNERFAVPEGFIVEELAGPNAKTTGLDPRLPFSLINMTFDAKGRLLVSQERGPIVLCTEPDAHGAFQKIQPYCEQVKNCQGMCWVKDALLLVGDGPQGTGLYRCRDTNGDDRIDKVDLMHKFKGGMGEHGPHAILHGPDGWLYLVIGNHAWAQPDKLAANSPLLRWPSGTFGPDQGRPDTTEDVLLPRLNDSRGHAANILAPGGTIWRFDHEGKNFSLVTAGFRNHFDAAFNTAGELFTFDSDMEWDEALPWYRAVRVCHCPPGADFVWRTGAANTPDYYIDSLPPLAETGRGSPVGVCFYEHNAYPEKYRGAFFMADWSIGVIYAVHLKRNGASFKGDVEKFCVGTPMPVTDLETGPDGAIYFTTGGRGTAGGIYRIVYQNAAKPEQEVPGARTIVPQTQPIAAWRRTSFAEQLKDFKADGQKDPVKNGLAVTVNLLKQPHADKNTNPEVLARNRKQLLTMMQMANVAPDATQLLDELKEMSAESRAHAIWLLGVNGYKEGTEAFVKALGDVDPLVRRRACEALIRVGQEPPLDALWPLLNDKDRFVRTAARLVLQRIDPKKWTPQLWSESNKHTVLEGIIALCKTNNADAYGDQIFEVLHQGAPRDDVMELLNYLRTVQMAVIHTSKQPGSSRGIALECLEMFPHNDWRVNRELAILLTHFRKNKELDEPVHAKLLDALLKAKDDRMQQIHYFYCLRFLHDGWTSPQKDALLTWFDSTKTWTGGHSFMPFLDNILRDLKPIFTAEDRRGVLARIDQLPKAAGMMLAMTPDEEMPPIAVLAEAYGKMVKAGINSNELKEVIFRVFRSSNAPEVQPVMRSIADADPSARDAVAYSLCRFPSEENYRYIVRGLQSTNAPVLAAVMQTLKRIPTKPAVPKDNKGGEPGPYRAVLVASSRLEARDKMKAVDLLRHWTGRRFSVEDNDWKAELDAFGRWFNQTFPTETPLGNIATLASLSKWKFDELQKQLDQDSANGNVTKGRAVFEKANCIKCHKFGNIGEGLGPDLTTWKNRFKRVDVIESVIYPSKIISDQYRGTTILTKKGQTITGLAAPQGGLITVLQLDGTKVTLKVEEVDQQVASTVSPMPEKLFDELTLQDIKDLFAFLEADPPK